LVSSLGFVAPPASSYASGVLGYSFVVSSCSSSYGFGASSCSVSSCGFGAFSYNVSSCSAALLAYGFAFLACGFSVPSRGAMLTCALG
jgi:hypothetical protein